MASFVKVNTYTHSVTYVTDQMLRSLRLIIVLVGLDPAKYVNNWATYERAISTWLLSGHLQSVILEISGPLGGLITRCDFTIDYGYGGGDGTMWVDTDALRFAIVKFGTIPAHCNYKVTLMTNPGSPDVPGWGDSSLLPTNGFIKQGLGATIGTHAIGAQASYWRKI
jgi:hypothetical protein